SLFKFSAYPGPINARTTSIHKRHDLRKGNIDVRLHVLAQPSPSQFNRNLIRTLLAIHLYDRRRTSAALQPFSESQFHRGHEAVVHFQRLWVRPKPTAEPIIKEGGGWEKPTPDRPSLRRRATLKKRLPPA